MAELGWGAGGVQAYIADTQAQQQNDLTLVEGKIKIQTAQRALAQQDQTIALMQKAGLMGGQNGSQSNSPTDLASSMDKMSEIYMAVGQPEAAADVAYKASEIRKNTAQIGATVEGEKLKKLAVFDSLLSGVKDQASWDQANMMYKAQTGEDSPWAKLKYDPGIVEKLKYGMQTAAQKSITNLNQQRIVESQEKIRADKALERLRDAQADLAKSRAANLGKVGGKLPLAGDVSAAANKIRSEYPEIDAPTARTMGAAIAERSLDLVRNSGLSRSQATERAYQEAKSDGTFAGYKGKAPQKGSYAAPITLTPEIAKKPVEDTWYVAPNGKVVHYIGGGKYSDEPPPTSSNNVPDEDDEEES